MRKMENGSFNRIKINLNIELSTCIMPQLRHRQKEREKETEKGGISKFLLCKPGNDEKTSLATHTAPRYQASAMDFIMNSLIFMYVLNTDKQMA